MKYIIGILIIGTLFLTNCRDNSLSEKLEKENLNRYTSIENQIDSLINNNSNFEAISAGIITPSSKWKIHKGKLLNGQRPNDKSLYEIASITKTFTGTLLAHAISEKRIKINDDIREHLPAKYADLLLTNHPISFRHLATHRSGLPLFFPHHPELFESELDWVKISFELNKLHQGFSKEDFFESLSQYKFQTIPGTNTMYSNAGTNLVGYILEEIYDLPFEEILENKILTPLKMGNTTIILSKADKDKLVKGQNEKKIEMPFIAEKEMNAGGGMISNIDDMLKYLDFHLNSDSDVAAISHTRQLYAKPNDYHEGLFWQLKTEMNKPVLHQYGGSYGTYSWS